MWYNLRILNGWKSPLYIFATARSQVTILAKKIVDYTVMNKMPSRRKLKVAKPKKVVKYRRAAPKDPLDRRVLGIAAQRSFNEAAEKTMAVMGFNVIARNGWVGKLFPDNRFEKISEIAQVTIKK